MFLINKKLLQLFGIVVMGCPLATMPLCCDNEGDNRMKGRKNIVVLFLSLLAFPYISSFSQIEAIGSIYLTDKDSIPIGTAFVAGKSKSIYTCSHVAVKDTLWFSYIGSTFLYRITIKYNLPSYDVAFLERTGGSQPKSLEFGHFDRVQPGDSIQYIGWDVRYKNYVFWNAKVLAKGSALMSENCNVDFIEFEGKAIPGYSGGPVFDKSNKVIAMIREAWSKKGVKGGEQISINRAFSIELLNVLDSEVKTKSVIGNNNSGSFLIELLIQK